MISMMLLILSMTILTGCPSASESNQELVKVRFDDSILKFNGCEHFLRYQNKVKCERAMTLLEKIFNSDKCEK